jgi:membrane protein
MARIAGRVLGTGAAVRTRVQAQGDTVRSRITGALAALRRRWPWFDHLAAAYGLYQDKQGGSLAGAATFFGFLSFFPLVALAFSVAGYAVVISPHTAADWLTKAIQSVIPGLAGQLPIESIARARARAGVLGLLGLLIVGLGGVDAFRDGLHRIWGSGRPSGNVIARKAWDVVVLAVVGMCLVASVAASALAVSASTGALASAGLSGSTAGQVATRFLAIAVAVIFDTVMFAFVFSRLSGANVPRQRLLPGAVLAAVGFEALKLIGVYLVARTTRNPIYASFAVMVGLLVWINLVARLAFLAAAWTATSRRGPVQAGLPARRAAAPGEPVPGERERGKGDRAHGKGHRDSLRR